MSWLNPWAWLGLAALAVPVLIHLLGRGHARVVPFPTLRFFEPSRLLPTRRTRLHDLLLLAVRVAMLVVAVAALAQPALRLSRTRALAASKVRAIIVDTSASMRRTTPAGERAMDAARREAVRFAGEARTSETIETAALPGAIASAAAWLARQEGGARELVIVSDFQLGALDSAALAAVPQSVGIQFSRIAVESAPGAVEVPALAEGGERVARVTPLPDRTEVEWGARSNDVAGRRGAAPASTVVPSGSARGGVVPEGGLAITVYAAASERARANAARRAASVLGVRLPMDTGRARRVALVTPGFEGRAELLRRAGPPSEAWMVDLVIALRSDSTLSRLAAGAPALGADSAHGLVAVRDPAGRPVVLGLADDTLWLVSSVEPGNALSAMIIGAATRALSRAAPLSELEPAVLPQATLAAWQRPAAAGRGTGASDGRWLWAVVLLLMGVEAWMRRTVLSAAGAEARVHDRAA